jgi:hypothetical protein
MIESDYRTVFFGTVSQHMHTCVVNDAQVYSDVMPESQTRIEGSCSFWVAFNVFYQVYYQQQIV